MSRRLTRRRFVQQTAAFAVGVGLASSRLKGEARSPNEKLNIGIIGAGGRGATNLRSVSSQNIVALCDVDQRRAGRAFEQYPKAAKYKDFRVMLDKEQKNLDAVVISTTDFTHAPAAVRAMRRGLHVYCEKPLAHTVAEARLMRETYRKQKVATQMGTQIHARDNYRRVVELVQSGAIGPVREAHVWCNRFSSQAPPPQGKAPIPEGLDWDLWLGPAPYRPYQNGYMPGNLTWNRYWDFGNGILGDMGSHLIDLPYWALDLRYPATVEADAPTADPVIYPPQLIVTWEHPRRGDGPHEQACKVVWYDGRAKPNELFGIDLSKYGIGALFVGDEGMLLADYGRRSLHPAEKFADYKPPEPWIPPSLGHHREWIEAAKAGDHEATLCNFEYSGRLIEHNLLGTVAHRVGRKLQWDAERLKAANAPEADRYIHKQYRKGWEFET